MRDNVLSHITIDHPKIGFFQPVRTLTSRRVICPHDGEPRHDNDMKMKDKGQRAPCDSELNRKEQYPSKCRLLDLPDEILNKHMDGARESSRCTAVDAR